MESVYLGLGANLGDRAGNVRTALAMLGRRGVRTCVLSPFYETEPWGYLEQPPFLNAACLVQTGLEPSALLRTLKDVECELGRVETVRYGPRPVDLDILLYGERIVETAELTIPHPGMLERATVLVPLADIAPCLRHPRTGRTIAEHLEDLGPLRGLAPYRPGLSGRR